MHNLIICSPEYAPKPFLRRVLDNKIVGIVCGNTINLIVDHVGHKFGARLDDKFMKFFVGPVRFEVHVREGVDFEVEPVLAGECCQRR